MADGYTIKSVEEFEEMEGSGNATWRLARKTLGAESFGFNVVDIGPGGQIPEHDHSGDNQEEVYIILDGRATLVTDAKSVTRPPGPTLATPQRSSERSATTRTAPSAPC